MSRLSRSSIPCPDGTVYSGKVIAGTKTETFIKATKVPVHLPLGGRTMDFDAAGNCVAGC